jgi:formylglycine-generating enzyme required for sulfatase activity
MEPTVMRSFSLPRRLAAVAVLAYLTALPAAVAAEDPYTRRDTWQETLRLSLEKLVAAMPEDATAGPQGVLLGPWYQLGPFAADPQKGFETEFPPLRGVDLTKPCGGKAWQRKGAYDDGAVIELTAPGQAATFLFRVVKAPAPLTLTAYFGSDDGLAVWLNRERILANPANRGMGPNQDQAQLALKAGDNELLLMIYNNQGGHGYYFSTNPTPGSARAAALGAIWNRLISEFPAPDAQREIGWEREDGIWNQDWPAGDLAALARRYAELCAVPEFAAQASAAAATCKTETDLQAARSAYYTSKWCEKAEAVRRDIQTANVRLAVQDLARRFPGTYPGQESLARLDAFDEEADRLCAAAAARDPEALKALPVLRSRWDDLRRELLLANPLIDFEQVLFVRRKGSEGLTQNWQGNDPLHGHGFDNEITTFRIRQPEAPEERIYKPDEPIFVGDVDLHFDADRMLFSTNGTVCEVRTDGSGFRKVVTEVSSYDPCYLPDGRILFVSNCNYHAVPCVGGADYVGNIHLCEADGSGIRRLCFDQDNNWCPVMLANGRVLYTRWEYTDSAHYFARVLMHMNPDGTNQVEFYGSNSYWPNSMFYARPIPGSPTKFVAIVSGHHGPARMGELVLFDAARGRHEASGALQKIPGHGRPVEAVTKDDLVGAVWPKFLHPYPLSEAHFLVSCRLTTASPWGIYLADIFDNLVPLRVIPGVHCLEPVPLRPTPRPPLLPDRIRPGDKEATVYIQDVDMGRGLRNLPRGLVKSLRVFQYEYAYRNTGGHNVIGYEGPWDVRRVLGTVPVFADGSAVFRIPANTPVSVQPLDAEGKALAVMRSWFAAMPGEVLSCVGCHEEQNSVPLSRNALASQSAPGALTPWYGPARGFSFQREVQPVLDRHCVGCHSDKREDIPSFVDDGKWVSFDTAQNRYSKSYLALMRYVRRNGPEGDYHTLTPAEFHADTSELIQRLQKGHHGVHLDAEAWDRLITWIDVNVPFYGTWREAAPNIGAEQVTARFESRRKYASVEEHVEAVEKPYAGDTAFVPPAAVPTPPALAAAPAGWPFSAERARQLQGSAEQALTLDLADGVALDLVRIPAGSFLIGDAEGDADEQPVVSTSLAKGFWLGRTEVTVRQYALFDPQHDNGVYDQRWKDQTRRGYFVNEPELPAIRVSWLEAMRFCAWLSEKTGRKVTLPTEAQWEWACRAGTATALNYGALAADFAAYANLADVSTKKLVVVGVDPQPVADPHPLACFLPAIMSVNDKVLHLAKPATYAANAWGLYDMHGNVAEWTRSLYRPYPYSDDDGRNDAADHAGKRVVRGGSWHERPARARSAFRLAYPAWQQVFNVGFRVAIED